MALYVSFIYFDSVFVHSMALMAIENECSITQREPNPDFAESYSICGGNELH